MGELIPSWRQRIFRRPVGAPGALYRHFIPSDYLSEPP